MPGHAEAEPSGRVETCFECDFDRFASKSAHEHCNGTLWIEWTNECRHVASTIGAAKDSALRNCLKRSNELLGQLGQPFRALFRLDSLRQPAPIFLIRRDFVLRFKTHAVIFNRAALWKFRSNLHHRFHRDLLKIRFGHCITSRTA